MASTTDHEHDPAPPTLVDKRTSAARPRKAAETAELERLREKVARLEKESAAKGAALDLMGKAHALLELLSESAD